jgi:hypothetical protein
MFGLSFNNSSLLKNILKNALNMHYKGKKALRSTACPNLTHAEFDQRPIGIHSTTPHRRAAILLPTRPAVSWLLT